MFFANTIIFIIVAATATITTCFESIQTIQSQEQQSKFLAPTQTSRVQVYETREEYPPRLIHQPQDYLCQPNKPQTIECPVEANPPADIRWFKDNLLLNVQMPHSEQHSNDLIINEINDDDTGVYYCKATNSLGTIKSEQFKLTVQSSIYDPNVRLEPRQAEVGVDKQVAFLCTIPIVPSSSLGAGAGASGTQNNNKDRLAKQRQQQALFRPEVSWKRDGKRLLVKWLDDGEDLVEARSRFVARQSSIIISNGGGRNNNNNNNNNNANVDHVQYTLIITRVQLEDDNSTFTCTYKNAQADFDSYNNNEQQQELAHESNEATLRVYTDLQDLQQENNRAQVNNILNNNNKNSNSPISLQNPNLGPPIYDLVNKTTQLLDFREDPQQSGGTSTNLNQGDGVNSGRNNSSSGSLQRTLLDLFEIAKPTLIIFGILFLVSLFVMIQFIYFRHRKNINQNRYMKHSSSLSNHHHLNHHLNHAHNHHLHSNHASHNLNLTLNHNHNHHHQQTYSNGSSLCGLAGQLSGSGGTGSGTSNCSSSGGSANINLNTGSASNNNNPTILTGTFVDPMLNSLMGRTLSVPGSNGIGGAFGGVGKRYMSYRDHMRKVAAAATVNDNNNILSTISNGCDFLDSNFVKQLQHKLQLESAAAANSSEPSVACVGGQQQQLTQQEASQQFFLGGGQITNNNNTNTNTNINSNTSNIVRPNLYDQSLAAREQARSLLQTSEHIYEHIDEEYSNRQIKARGF